YIDLFAGIGGFHQAMSSFGAECVFASEWDRDCQDTYEANYGMRPWGDITQIEADEIPPHDVICAGFPCQAFSISGKQRGFEDTRGTLFFDVVRIAKHHKPKMLLLENVKNFEKHDNGNTLQVVKDSLDELGYSVFHQVLNASHFGVPQKRERIFIVAFRSDLSVEKFEFPHSSGEATMVQDFLLPSKEVEELIIERNDIVFKESVIVEKDMFGNYPQKPIRLGIVGKGGQGERIYSPLGHAITLSAYGGGIGAKTGIYMVDGVMRRLAPRECMRITGFPEDFLLHSNKNVSYRQFGNSVVVNVLKAIVDKVIECGCLDVWSEESVFAAS
ncbi:MAG: DNA cytosine methyltransferase, partial [Campylobacterota bacterium]|nr:DNA cytosine methyltransferase [Campylobacterota bacterium]